MALHSVCGVLCNLFFLVWHLLLNSTVSALPSLESLGSIFPNKKPPDSCETQWGTGFYLHRIQEGIRVPNWPSWTSKQSLVFSLQSLPLESLITIIMLNFGAKKRRDTTICKIILFYAEIKSAFMISIFSLVPWLPALLQLVYTEDMFRIFYDSTSCYNSATSPKVKTTCAIRFEELKN